MGSPPRALMLAMACTLAACTSKDDPDKQVDPDTDGDTDTLRDGAPTQLDLTCAPTTNALRFECTVHVDPPQPVELQFVRADGLGATRTVAGAETAADHVLPLYFMAPAKDYAVTVHATAWPDPVASTSVTTGTPPTEIASSILTEAGAASFPMIGVGLPCMEPGDRDGYWDDAIAVVYDTATGDLLWYENMDPGGSFGPNDMVVFTDEFTVLGESYGDIVEVDLMGRDLVRLPGLADALGATAGGLFGNFHHDIAKHDGVYYVMYEQDYGEPGVMPRDVLDNVILFDGTGTEIARWLAEEHLPIPQEWGGLFTSMNAMDVDPEGDILMSIKAQDTVIKVEGDWTSPSFGEVIWSWNGTGIGAIGNTIAADWSGVGPPAIFSFEHSLFVRPNDGQLMLLDNDHGRALRMDIDEVAQTGRVVGEYPTNYPECGPQGTARTTLAGNPIVGCSGGRYGSEEYNYVREYDPVTEAVLWEARPVCGDGSWHNATRWYALEGW
jgi:hypothetical protein